MCMVDMIYCYLNRNESSIYSWDWFELGIINRWWVTVTFFQTLFHCLPLLLHPSLNQNYYSSVNLAECLSTETDPAYFLTELLRSWGGARRLLSLSSVGLFCSRGCSLWLFWFYLWFWLLPTQPINEINNSNKTLIYIQTLNRCEVQIPITHKTVTKTDKTLVLLRMMMLDDHFFSGGLIDKMTIKFSRNN